MCVADGKGFCLFDCMYVCMASGEVGEVGEGGRGRIGYTWRMICGMDGFHFLRE